jgi:hypothetical protein
VTLTSVFGLKSGYKAIILIRIFLNQLKSYIKIEIKKKSTFLHIPQACLTLSRRVEA